MAEQYEIRGADRKELPEVIELLEPAYAELGTEPEKGVREHVLADVLKPHTDWWVATADQRVVGAMHTVIASETNSQGVTTAERMMVGDVVVDPDYRRRGLGSALIERAIDFSEERLITSIKLDIPAETIALKALAAKNGFGSEKPFVLDLPEPVDISDIQPIAAENKLDARIPTPAEKKIVFLQSVYPDEEFSPEEVDAIFSSLPQIVSAHSVNFHPRTRNKLDEYTAVLDTYVQSREPVSAILPATGFNSKSALLVWKNGFAKSLRIIDPAEMRVLAMSFAAQESSAR